MRTSVTHEVTRLLGEWQRGNEAAVAELIPLVYGELRQLAAAYLRGERQDHTLQPTALVHEAYLRLVDQSASDWQSRSHFYCVAARVMRQVLVDHARRKQAKKRAAEPVPLQQVVSFQQDRSDDLVALDDSLTDLEKIDARKCQAIELRYFAGLTMDQIAQTMNVSVQTDPEVPARNVRSRRSDCLLWSRLNVPEGSNPAARSAKRPRTRGLIGEFCASTGHNPPASSRYGRILRTFDPSTPKLGSLVLTVRAIVRFRRCAYTRRVIRISACQAILG